MNALARLLNSRREELGISWDAVAARGGFSSHTIAYALAHKSTLRQTPKFDTLEKLATALDLPLGVVCEAAGDSVGCGIRPELRPLTEAAAHLNREQLAQLIGYAHALLASDTPHRTGL